MTEELPPRIRALHGALVRAAREAGAPPDFVPELERPRNPDHGDFATNAAMILSGILEEPPRAIADRIVQALDRDAARIESADVAGPGFINFRLSDRVLWKSLARVLDEDEDYGRHEDPGAGRVNVEFVSANPTGPLHVAHGRGAALGDAVASLLEWAGHEVCREFYVNDAGAQIRKLGESVEARWQELRGGEGEIPEGGYHGGYVLELARAMERELEVDLSSLSPEDRIERFAREAATRLQAEHDQDLQEFGVNMDHWQQESDLYESGAVEETLSALEERDLLYRDEGAVWLRTTELGDEKDRVLVKSDGSYTYFLPDIAYHRDKARRGWDLAVDVLGADHHGHVPRMKGALRALDLGEDFLQVVLIQLVTVLRGGEEVRMSKRAGDFVTLRELYRETGVDVARYFFLMRRAEVSLQFDLDLALDTSEKNPVYKVQYAHARMCSVFERAGVDPGGIRADADQLARLETEAEREVTQTLLRFPSVVRTAARARAPYQVCTYLEELAGAVNSWYHRGNVDPDLRVLAEGPARPARLALARAVQITLRNGLRLLGLSAPERMEREPEDGTPEEEDSP